MKKIVLVEWLDSAVTHGWHRLSREDCVSRCVSVGIVVHEDERQIVLASSQSDYGNVADTNAIPKCSIVRMRKLEVKRWLL